MERILERQLYRCAMNQRPLPIFVSGQKAALVILLHYEEERRKARERQLATLKQNTDTEIFQGREVSGETAKILANKAGITPRYMYQLLAVYKSRLDLFQLVKDGKYSINKAYTQMKADEAPEVVEEIPVEILDVDEWQAEYLLIAENWERRGKAETDPIKVSRILKFLEEYWTEKGEYTTGRGNRHNADLKTQSDLAGFVGEDIRTAKRILKLNDLIPEIQALVSSGKLGTIAAVEYAHISPENLHKAIYNLRKQGGIKMNEIKGGGAPGDESLSIDLNVITAEINAYQRVAGEAIFEIGRRLKKVRDNPEEYGFVGFRDWEQWCHEKLDMSRRNANRFIKVFDRFAEKPGTPVSRLPNSMSVLYALTDFTDDELEKPREMPDGSTKKLTEMSRREIEEFKAREKKAIEEKEKALLAAEESNRRAKQAEAQRDIALRESDILVVCDFIWTLRRLDNGGYYRLSPDNRGKIAPHAVSYPLSHIYLSRKVSINSIAACSDCKERRGAGSMYLKCILAQM